MRQPGAVAKMPAGSIECCEPYPVPVATLLRLRFSVWQSRLPVDALPLEGWIELRLLSEEDLMALSF